MLTPREQWQLHDYYRFTEPLTDLKLLKHRSKVSTERPSLPAQAGRALAHLTSQPDATTATTDGVRVYGLVRPALDAADLAQLLVEIATQTTKPKRSDPRRGDVEDHAA